MTSFSRLWGVGRPVSFLVVGQARSMAGVLSSWSLSPKSTTISGFICIQSWGSLTLSTPEVTRLAAGGILNLQRQDTRGDWSNGLFDLIIAVVDDDGLALTKCRPVSSLQQQRQQRSHCQSTVQYQHQDSRVTGQKLLTFCHISSRRRPKILTTSMSRTQVSSWRSSVFGKRSIQATYASWQWHG